MKNAEMLFDPELIIQAQSALSSSVLSADDLPYLVLQKIRELMGADHASFLLKEDQVLKYGASTDRNWENQKPSHTAIHKALNSPEGVFLQNPSGVTASTSQVVEKILSCLAIRISRSSFTGVVYCDIREGKRLFTSEDVQRLQFLCAIFEVYFYCFFLNETTKELKEQKSAAIQERIRNQSDFHQLVGNSVAIQDLREKISAAAGHDWPVFMNGETGTGKELVAQAIHYLSRRARKELVRINCAELSPTLIEAQLFGNKKGAYTGAEYRRGYILTAAGGTLFLDEIGELPLEFQAKFLRILENKELRQLGTDDVVHVDFRLITASNRNLIEMVKQGKFREDLYERICVKRIYVPPLRERKEDIAELSKFFAAPKQITKEAIEYLEGLDYPGNVRRLMSIVGQARDESSGALIEKLDVVRIASQEQEGLKHLDQFENQKQSEKTSKDRVDFWRFKNRYQTAFLEIRGLRKIPNSSADTHPDLSEESRALLNELQRKMETWFFKHGSWSAVARTIFGLSTDRERKGFTNWVYQLQLNGALQKPNTESGQR